MALGVVLQTSQLFKHPSSSDPRLVLADAKLTDRPGQADVGHLRYTVTGAQIERVADPKDSDESQLLAHITVRIADQKGISDYIDNETFHLVVDGDTVNHSNNVNVTVYENASAETELVFVLPEEVGSAELLVGRRNEGAARIPVALSPRRMAEGS